MGELIGFRALQGIGAGGLLAGAFALIGVLLPPRERGGYQGLVAIIQTIGGLGGPLVGGFVTTHLGWRWAFYINIPIGLVCLVWCALMLHLPAVSRRGKVVIDWLGITLMTSAITVLVLAATWAGSTYTWGSWQILGLAGLFVVLLAAFVAAERRAAEPLMPTRIFTGHRNFPISAVLLAVAGVSMFGATLYLPLYQQTVQGASAANSGVLLLPLMIGSVVASLIAGRVMSRTGRYKLFPVVGAASLAAALFRTLGGSVGVAIFGALLTRALAGTGVGNASVGESGAAGSTTVAGRSAPAEDAYLHAVAHGTQQIFLVGALCAAAAFLAAVFIKESPLRGKPAPNQDTEREPAAATS
jgi:MFS family permease